MKHRTLALKPRQPPLLCKGGQAELRTMQTSQIGAVATNDDVIAPLILHRSGAAIAVRDGMCMSSSCKMHALQAASSWPWHLTLCMYVCNRPCVALCVKP